MTHDDDALSLDPDFVRQFERDMRRPACQLYLISPPAIDEAFVDQLGAALDGGPVAAFQLRLKDIDEDTAARLAEPLQRLCEAREVAFIVNDSVALAKRLGADGVHLGQDDGDPREARKILGLQAQIGITCHDSRHLAMEAGEAGADYVAFGAFFPTQTKEPKTRTDPEILRAWSMATVIPCVAIGGITVDNAPALVEAGADFLAVSAGVWDHADGPQGAVAAFNALF